MDHPSSSSDANGPTPDEPGLGQPSTTPPEPQSYVADPVTAEWIGVNVKVPAGSISCIGSLLCLVHGPTAATYSPARPDWPDLISSGRTDLPSAGPGRGPSESASPDPAGVGPPAIGRAARITLGAMVLDLYSRITHPRTSCLHGRHRIGSPAPGRAPRTSRTIAANERNSVTHDSVPRTG